jgi:hypothetical protein
MVVPGCRSQGARFASACRSRSWTLLLVLLMLRSASVSFAQDTPSDEPETLHGAVVNSVTREPISRALVFSPDNRFATMTDAQGRFEFSLPASTATPKNNPTGVNTGIVGNESNRPYMLTARKPGFLVGTENETQGVQISPQTKEVTIELMPEALIVGHVTLPSSEPPDKIQLDLYKREVQDGRAHWIPHGATTSFSNGEFRFAELPAGTYKLFTRELSDTDAAIPKGQQFAYTPVYYPNASDFSSGSEIQLSPGKTFTADLSLTRQPYFPIRIPVANVSPGAGVNVSVSLQGRRGPGYALEYNAQEQRIEGALPNGNFVLDVVSFGSNPMSGSTTILVRGGPVEGPGLAMIAGRSIPVEVREEFTSNVRSGATMTTYSGGKPAFTTRGVRADVSVSLLPAEDFVQGGRTELRAPSGPQDQSMVLDGVNPGRYWVRITSARGYVAAVTSGAVDLMRSPLVVGTGGTVSPIEVTLRDDTAQLDGVVEGPVGDTGGTGTMQASGTAAYAYCIPMDESSGQYTALPISGDGKIFPVALPPGAYRILAFKRTQNLEYRNPESMRALDGKGTTVRLLAGQTEHVQVPLVASE